jgi:hypothetical protein
LTSEAVAVEERFRAKYCNSVSGGEQDVAKQSTMGGLLAERYISDIGHQRVSALNTKGCGLQLTVGYFARMMKRLSAS